MKFHANPDETKETETTLNRKFSPENVDNLLGVELG